MMEFTLRPIGTIKRNEGNYFLQLNEEFVQGLLHIEEFSHLHIIWWAHLTDDPEVRKRIVTKNLFKTAPAETGVFASRTPERPNPIMLSTIKVESIDMKNGIIHTPFIDAEDGTPVLDIKPYFPMERIRDSKTPSYYSHWPEWAEDSSHFNWKDEISFDGL